MPAHWEQLQQHGQQPGPRSSHCMAYANGCIYLFGGELEPRVPVPADTYCYDLAAGSWSKLDTAGECPGPRVAAKMAAIGNKVYLFGGRTGVDMGEGATCDLYCLDTSTARWEPVRPGSNSSSASTPAAPAARSYHAMAAAGGKLYVFGGCGAAGRQADLWEFDPSAAAWRQLPGCPAVGPRGGSSMVAAAGGSKLLVLGGFNGAAEMFDCHTFDIPTLSWSCPTCCPASTDSQAAAGADSSTGGHSSSLTMPLARSVFGVATHAGCSDGGGECPHTGHIIAFGGEVAPSDKGHAGAGNFCAATFCLSPPGEACGAACQQAAAAACDGSGAAAAGHSGWHVLDTAGAGPGPRGWFADAVVPGGDLAVHGGLGGDNSRLADMHRLHMH